MEGRVPRRPWARVEPGPPSNRYHRAGVEPGYPRATGIRCGSIENRSFVHLRTADTPSCWLADRSSAKPGAMPSPSPLDRFTAAVRRTKRRASRQSHEGRRRSVGRQRFCVSVRSQTHQGRLSFTRAATRRKRRNPASPVEFGTRTIQHCSSSREMGLRPVWLVRSSAGPFFGTRGGCERCVARAPAAGRCRSLVMNSGDMTGQGAVLA